MNLSEKYEKTLMDIISSNKKTIFGSIHEFECIDSYDLFTTKVPLSDYNWSIENNPLEEYIFRTSKGEENVLSSLKTEGFFVTAGTSGPTKLIPRTAKSSIVEQVGIKANSLCNSLINNKIQTYANQAVELMLPRTEDFFEALLDCSGGLYYHKNTSQPIGTANSFRIEEVVTEVLDNKRRWKFSTPPEIHLITNYENFLFISSVFILQTTGLNTIHGSYITSIIAFFECISHRWKDIVRSIKDGAIEIFDLKSYNPEVDDNQLKKIIPMINASLEPNATRAVELENIFREASASSSPLYGIGIAKVIWPRLSIISCLCSGEGMSHFEKPLREFIGNSISLFSPYCGGSEGVIGINLWPGQKTSCFVFTPEFNFVEFIPEQNMSDDNPNTTTVDQLEIEANYEIILTTYSGLYRYRIGDIIRIVDKDDNGDPIFDFVKRKSSLLNLFNEMVTADHIRMALTAAFNTISCSQSLIKDFACSIDLSSETQPFYKIYLELNDQNASRELLEKLQSNISRQLDASLCLLHDPYGRQRAAGKIGQTQVLLLVSGAFEALRALIKSSGHPTGQSVPPPRIIYSERQINLLNAMAIGADTDYHLLSYISKIKIERAHLSHGVS